LGILSGVVSYLFGLVLNLLDACIDGFLGALGFDLDTFESYFPAARDYHDVIIGFAIGLLFIMLVFQIFRNFGVVLEMEVEDPLKMVGKTALFLGMIVYSRSIMEFVIRLLVDPYAIFLGAVSAPYEFKLMTVVTSMFSSVFSNPFMAIVALIMMLVLGWQFLKLAIECVERYVVFYFVLYCARWCLRRVLSSQRPKLSKAGAGCWRPRRFCYCSTSGQLSSLRALCRCLNRARIILCSTFC